ncbi:MAG TPA: hypothetical protein VMB50_03900 [Myxococcales bacterium]|nr:hypothetical protein [Myxococcales bacterium]
MSSRAVLLLVALVPGCDRHTDPRNPAHPAPDLQVPSFAARCRQSPLTCLGYQDQLTAANRLAAAHRSSLNGPVVSVASGACGTRRYVEERSFEAPAVDSTTWYFDPDGGQVGRRSCRPGPADGLLCTNEGEVPDCGR